MRPIVDLISMPIDFAKELSTELHKSGIDASLQPDPVEMIDRYNPEQYGCVVVYNWSDGQDSLELVTKLANLEVPPQIVLLVTNSNVNAAGRASKCGAAEVHLVTDPLPVIANSIRQSVEVDRVERPKALAVRDNINRIESLTVKEREVLRLMLAGVPNKVIASRLKVSQRTVETRRHKVFKKSETASLAELVRLAAKLEKHLNYLRVDGAEPLAGPKASKSQDFKAS